MNKELMELTDELMDAARLVKKEVKKITDKGDLTLQELESLYKAACFTEKLCKTCEMDSFDENSYGRYGHMMDRADMYGYSERRGRSPVTGRYISRGMDGMSGHSIEDRMVAALEAQMDDAKTEYERKTIQDEINRIRMGNR